MIDIQLTTDIGYDAAHKLQGTHPQTSDFDLSLGEQDCIVRTPQGKILFAYKRNAYRPQIAQAAYEILDKDSALHPGKNNRGNSTGKGKLPQPTQSGVMGFFDRNSRMPYCRATAFTERYPEDWQGLRPFFQQSAQLYQEVAPEEYAQHLEASHKVLPDWLIPGTPFSTATVNASYKTAYHYDAGNFSGGLTCQSTFRAGQFSQGHLVFPRYRVAVDLASCSFIAYNARELHGNLPFVGAPKAFKRISVVMYLRENMHFCETPQGEIDRVQKRTPGQPLNG